MYGKEDIYNVEFWSYGGWMIHALKKIKCLVELRVGTP